MEALVAIFADIIIACLLPVMAGTFALVSFVFEAILLLFGGTFAAYVEARRAKRAKTANKPATPYKPLIPRKVIHWVAGTSAVVGVLGIVASYVFFQPILRTVMDITSEKTGMSVAYGKASGSLLGGNVVLEDLVLSRAHDTGLAFGLQIERASADVVLTSLIFGTPTLNLGQANGVTGTITPPLPKEEKKGLPKPRRPFRAELLSIENVALQVTPRGETPYDVSIDRAEVAPFNSQLAFFDLLFRSNMTAEIAGQTLIVETRNITADGRETRWAFEDVDAAQLKQVLPKAPLTWIDGGRITVAVSDKWSLSDEFVDMDWRIATSDMQTFVPRDAGAAERVLAAGLGKYVEKFGGDVDFRYRLELDPTDMAQLRDGNLDDFWKKLLSGIAKGGVVRDEARTGAKEALEEEAPGALDRLKSILKRDGDEE